MTNKSIREYINLIENAQREGVSEGSSTMWEVSFEYGPHMSETIKVKAGSEEDAIAKVEKAAEKRSRSIMVNWAKPAEQAAADAERYHEKWEIAEVEVQE